MVIPERKQKAAKDKYVEAKKNRETKREQQEVTNYASPCKNEWVNVTPEYGSYYGTEESQYGQPNQETTFERRVLEEIETSYEKAINQKNEEEESFYRKGITRMMEWAQGCGFLTETHGKEKGKHRYMKIKKGESLDVGPKVYFKLKYSEDWKQWRVNEIWFRES